MPLKHKLYLGGYNPFDGKPDEDLHKQGWYFTKIGAPYSIISSMMLVFHTGRNKTPIEMLGIAGKQFWPLIAIAYGGVACSALIYKTRGDNWRSKSTPYFLGFWTAGSIVLTKVAGNSMTGVYRGFPIACVAALMQLWREKGWPNEFNMHQPHTTENSHDAFGHYGQKDQNFSNTIRYIDPGRRPVF